MSLLLLDTTFLIDAERNAAVAAVTIAELLVGVKLATRRYRERRQEYVDAVMTTVPVSDYDVGVAAEHAELFAAVRKSGRPRGAHDLIIAATARATNHTVVTADLTAFDNLPGVSAVAHR